MKDLVLKKKTELEELCRRTHLISEVDNSDFPLDAIETGAVNPSLALEQIELQIASVKEEAFSRRDILERIAKWLAACDEEAWLEEYNRDENRYSDGRGAHLALMQAEKARTMVSKISAIVESLAAKVTAWESERGIEFIYDGVRVLSMLEEYNIVRQEKEEERKRQRDQKKIQGQLIAEQEVLFGSKPSPSRSQSAKKVSRPSSGGSNRRLSLGVGSLMQPPKTESLSLTNAALLVVARNCPHFIRFRLCIIDPHTPDYLTYQPLDAGFSAIVESCKSLRRLSVSGLLTDRVFKSIWDFAYHLEMLSVAFAGETDTCLHYILSRCKSLRKLKIKDCPFRDKALLNNNAKLETMRSLWMSSCSVSLRACWLLARKMPQLNVEVIDEKGGSWDSRPGDCLIEKTVPFLKPIVEAKLIKSFIQGYMK